MGLQFFHWTLSNFAALGRCSLFSSLARNLWRPEFDTEKLPYGDSGETNHGYRRPTMRDQSGRSVCTNLLAGSTDPIWGEGAAAYCGRTPFAAVPCRKRTYLCSDVLSKGWSVSFCSRRTLSGHSLISKDERDEFMIHSMTPYRCAELQQTQQTVLELKSS